MKQRNYSLDVMRLLAALAVVICHTYIFREYGGVLYMVVSRYAPRVSVSFFFAISGYYYIKSIDKKDIFKKQMKSLLMVYAVWTVVYYAASFVDNIILGDADIGTFLVERVIFFFTEGSYPHFWFLVALIYSVVFVTICNRLGGKKGVFVLTILSMILFVIGNLGSSYYVVGAKIPVLNVLYGEYQEVFFIIRGIFCMGLPYFMLGYWLNVMEEKIIAMDGKKFGWLYGIASVLYVVEILFLAMTIGDPDRPEVFVMLYPMAFMLMALLLRNPMPQWSKAAPFCKRMSGYIYYVHPLLVIIFEFLNPPSGVLYILVIGTAMISGVILMKLSEKIKFLNYFV
ncbi:MAG: acyltransferase [Lachnospiraceae bacterium]|nr:acyltransferase [Lachnospiraceae bacterium]